ncbi:MAG: hypothetical protein ACOC1K_07895 [Nanoarchaeota archaeon]
MKIENFIEKELSNYSYEKTELEEQLKKDLLSFDDYCFQLALLNKNHQNVKKQNKLDKANKL